MKPSSEDRPLLSISRAFVVQFRDVTDVEAGCFVGRVEHVVSGKATHFSSLKEILAFIERVLAEPRSEPL